MSRFAAILEWRKKRSAIAEGTPESDFREAMMFAEAFAALCAAQRGAPRAKAWGKPNVGARVYIGNDVGYISFSRQGDMSMLSRGKATLLISDLYPSQRGPFNNAKQAYFEVRQKLADELTEARVRALEEFERQNPYPEA